MLECPKCLVEYREGFTKCSDCDVLLVNKDEIKVEAKNKKRGTEELHEYIEVNEIFLVNILDQVDLSYITSILKTEDIPYIIKEKGSGKTIYGLNFMGSDLYVALEDYDKAKIILQLLYLEDKNDTNDDNNQICPNIDEEKNP